jgi:hypothetical protein
MRNTAAITGKLTLIYEQQLAGPGAPIPMTGEIEGDASFTMSEKI